MERERVNEIFVWFGGVSTVCHLELRRMKAPKYFYMKCAAIREDFLSAITEPAKCMEIKQQQQQQIQRPTKNGKKLQSEMVVVTAIFICRYCALCIGVVSDKLLHSIRVWTICVCMCVLLLFIDIFVHLLIIIVVS